MIRWEARKGVYVGGDRFSVFTENGDWFGCDALTVTCSPPFTLPDAARAWCEAREYPEPVTVTTSTPDPLTGGTR